MVHGLEKAAEHNQKSGTGHTVSTVLHGAAKGFSGLEMHSWNRSQRCVSVSHRIFCEESDEFVELKGTGQLKHIKWAFQLISIGKKSVFCEG